jgi:hypothetical protein
MLIALFSSGAWRLCSLDWALLPLPFVVVERQLARVPPAARVSSPRTWSGRWWWALVVVGLSAFGALGYRADRDTALILFTSRELSTGARLTGDHGGYTVEVPEGSWRRLPRGLADQESSDLSLSRADGTASMVSYVHAAVDSSLDHAVDSRRRLVESSASLDSFDERRFFLEGADLVPASVATLGVHGTGAGHAVYVVLTIATKDKVYELVGYTADPTRGRPSLTQLLMSFRSLTAGRT